MYYALRHAYDQDGNERGFYVSMHPHSEAPASHQGPVFETVEEADYDFHRPLGHRIPWRFPCRIGGRGYRL